jgi:hypothetical protein
MYENHDDAPFGPNPEPIDGHFLVTEKPCPVKLSAYYQWIESLPDKPSVSFQIKTLTMGLLHPTNTDEEWQEMIRKIREVEKQILIVENQKGGDALPVSNDVKP